jgi:hypothetical protein
MTHLHALGHTERPTLIGRGSSVDDIYIVVVRRKISSKSEVQDTKSDIGQATMSARRQEIFDKQ